MTRLDPESNEITTKNLFSYLGKKISCFLQIKEVMLVQFGNTEVSRKMTTGNSSKTRSFVVIAELS